MNILEINNLSKSFGKLNVLNKINISVPTKSIFGLLGPNGAGKTTLIRIINQIIGPDSGNIEFDGSQIKRSDIRRIGYLPEERGLYNKMKVGEHLVYLAQLKGLNGRKLKDTIGGFLEEFEITDWWSKKIEQLSKGMQQKLQFIIAIMHKPELVILDEPFSGFDPINTELIKQKILKLKEQGTTFILSTHRMESVEELCDHIALINKANVVLDGEVNDIKERFKKNIFEIKYKGKLLEPAKSDNRFSLLISENEENGNDLNSAQLKLENNTTINEVLETLIPLIEIHSLNEIIPSIHEIFISSVNDPANE